jgi:hypothetical protein
VKRETHFLFLLRRGTRYAVFSFTVLVASDSTHDSITCSAHLEDRLYTVRSGPFLFVRRVEGLLHQNNSRERQLNSMAKNPKQSTHEKSSTSSFPFLDFFTSKARRRSRRRPR